MLNRKGPWLGQVPLVLGPSSWGAGAFVPPRRKEPASSLQEGDEIPANGGRIQKRIGFLWFFPDSDVLDRIEAVLGERPSESIEVRVTFCNPTPGFAPVLGTFNDPDTGNWCDIELPDGWNDAWKLV